MPPKPAIATNVYWFYGTVDEWTNTVDGRAELHQTYVPSHIKGLIEKGLGEGKADRVVVCFNGEWFECTKAVRGDGYVKQAITDENHPLLNLLLF
jgi:hypothetical protein